MDMEVDYKRYQLSCELHGHEDGVRGICVCENAGIATSSRDKTVRFWSPDPSDKRKRNYTMSKIFLGHTSFVGPLAWIPPNEELPEGGIVSGGMDRLVLVWSVSSAEKMQTLRGHLLQVTGINVLDNGDIVSCSVDGILRRWRKGQVVDSWEAHKSAVQAVIKLPSGELVSASSDTTIKLWKGTTCSHTFVGHTDTVRSLAIMPGMGLLSASHDGSIRLWALTGQLLLGMVGHTSIVYSVDSHRSGLIVSGSGDRSAKIWKDGSCVQTIEHPGCVCDAKFLESGDIVTACSDGVVRIWTWNQDRVADKSSLEHYNSQISQYKLSSGIVAMKPKLLELDQGLDVLGKGISRLKDILEEGAERIDLEEEPCEMFNAVYTLCTQSPRDHSHRLLEMYKDAFEEYIMSTVLPAILKKQKQHDKLMLQELVKRSANHMTMVHYLSKSFQYLHRYFLPKSSLAGLEVIGHRCFHRMVYKHFHQKARKALIDLINEERDGAQIDRALVKDTVDIFFLTGMAQMNFYEQDFETHLLQETGLYYSKKAVIWMNQLSCPDYMLKSEECITKERDRVAQYLHPSSEAKLVEKVQHELLVNFSTQLA